MFTLVTKENVFSYIDEINLMEKEYFEELGDSLEKDILDGVINYIFYQKDGVLGGVKLVNPQENHEVEAYLRSHDILLNNYWVLEDVIFHVPNDLNLHEDPDRFEAACREYYKGLYDILQLLGPQHDKETLLTLNPYEDHEDIMFFGDWPFIAQHIIAAENEDDDLVLGLLTLQEAQASAA